MDEIILQLKSAIKDAGGYIAVAKKIGVSRQNLYHVLYMGNPRLHTVIKIADAVGLTLTLSKSEPETSPVQTTEIEETQ